MKVFFILLVMAVPESRSPATLNVMAVDHYETQEECARAAAALTYIFAQQNPLQMPHITCLPSDYDPRKQMP